MCVITGRVGGCPGAGRGGKLLRFPLRLFGHRRHSVKQAAGQELRGLFA